jgi:hypothetical protein
MDWRNTNRYGTNVVLVVSYNIVMIIGEVLDIV